MATVKTGTLYFWTRELNHDSSLYWRKVGTYILGRREFPWQAIDRFAKQGGIWEPSIETNASTFTPWHCIHRVSLVWQDETISEELAHKLIQEGRTDVVLGASEE